MNLLQKIKAVWQNVNIVQRVLLTAVALTFISVSGLVIYWVQARHEDALSGTVAGGGVQNY